MKLALGLLVSHGFPLPEAFEVSYRRVWSRLITGQCNASLPPDLQIDSVSELRQTSFPVDFARNEIIRAFLRGDADALLFLDADMTFPEDVAERLVRTRKPVVTGRYHMRKPPFHAAVYVKHRTIDDPMAYAPVHFGRGVFEIERAGAGCLLIQRDVLEGIARKQTTAWAHAWQDVQALSPYVRSFLPPEPNVQWFRYQHAPTPPYDMSVSEDFWFCQQAREAGYAIWCDWDCECGHIQPFVITREHNEVYLDREVALLPTLSAEARERTVKAFVCCGYPEGLTLPTGERVPPYAVTPGER